MIFVLASNIHKVKQNYWQISSLIFLSRSFWLICEAGIPDLHLSLKVLIFQISVMFWFQFIFFLDFNIFLFSCLLWILFSFAFLLFQSYLHFSFKELIYSAMKFRLIALIGSLLLYPTFHFLIFNCSWHVYWPQNIGNWKGSWA